MCWGLHRVLCMENLILSATITVTVGAAGGDATRSAAEEERNQINTSLFHEGGRFHHHHHHHHHYYNYCTDTSIHLFSEETYILSYRKPSAMSVRKSPPTAGPGTALSKRARVEDEADENTMVMTVASSGEGQRKNALIRSVKRTSSLEAPIVSLSAAHGVCLKSQTMYKDETDESRARLRLACLTPQDKLLQLVRWIAAFVS